MAFRFQTRRQLRAENEELRADNARLDRALHTDEDTGLPNKRKMKGDLAEVINRCLRFDNDLSLLFIDVNDLHNLNRRTSEEHVDDVLIPRLVQVVLETLRSTDFYRRSGDEFIVMLENTGPQGAQTVREKLKRAISEDPVLAKDGVSIAIGIQNLWTAIGDRKTVTIVSHEDIGELARTLRIDSEQDMKVDKAIMKTAATSAARS